MKKITAFFLAILPIFVVSLLFATGLIVKQYQHIYVTSVEITQDDVKIQKPEDSVNPTYELTANVLPIAATNPEVYWLSSDTNILDVKSTSQTTAQVTAKDFGEAYVYAVSKENETIKGAAKVEVWDNKVHRVEIANADELGFLGHYQKTQIIPKPIPLPSGEGAYTPSYEYSVTAGLDKGVSVTEDGWVKAKGDSTDASIQVKETHSEQTKQVDIKVGAGVYVAEFDTSKRDVIAGNTYDFHNSIVTAPDSSTNKTDFTYSVDDESIATINNEGLLTFVRAGEVEVTAQYKWMKDTAPVVHKIESTMNNFQDVNFGKYKYTFSKDEIGNNISSEDLGLYVYPESTDWSKVYINVVPSVGVLQLERDPQTSKPSFVIQNSGSCTITASVSGEFGLMKSDTISVYVQGNTSELIKETSVNYNKNFSYDLRSNLNLNYLNPTYQRVEWSIDGTPPTGVTIDTDNEILHFTDSNQTVKVIGKIGDEKLEFSVTCSYEQASPITIYAATNVKIKAEDVGKRFQFVDGLGVAYQIDQEYVPSNMYYDRNTYTFIPYGGCDTDIRLPYALVLATWVHLTVCENPISITYAGDVTPFYVTPTNSLNIPHDMKPSVRPNTARDEDGNLYNNFQYKLLDETAATLTETGVLTFDRAGTADISINLAGSNLVDNFTIKSTYGLLGKFTLKDSDKELSSGATETINLAEGQKQFTIDTSLLPGYIFSKSITTESTNKEVCSVSEVEQSGDNVVFIVTPKKYGTSTIIIDSGTFKFYLYISVNSSATDVNLYWKGIKLGTNQKTYTKNLELGVITTPLQAQSDVSATFNDKGVEIKDKTIKLNDSTIGWKEGSNTLVLKTSNNEEIKYELNYADKPDSFIVEESETVGGESRVYIPAGVDKQYLTIGFDGFVDDDFISQNNFTYKIDGGQSQELKSEKIKVETPDPKTAPSQVEISYDSKTYTYKLKRELVSKIRFPGHDNKDPTDQKGLQKVHVYGSYSFYTAAEGLIDYYKLPVELYDYQGNLITDEGDAKYTAFQDLTADFNSNLLSYQFHKPDQYNKEGFIEMHFKTPSFYTPEEIYNNAFETNDNNKTVSFTLRTHSAKRIKGSEASASYDFIVAGSDWGLKVPRTEDRYSINVYCQEGFGKGEEKARNSIVLQTNFGLEALGVKDNSPLTDPERQFFAIIYGNGYTMNFYANAAKPERQQVCLYGALNVTLESYNDGETPTEDNKFHFSIRDADTQPYTNSYLRYMVLKNAPGGIDLRGTNTGKQPAYFKNCLFFNNRDTSIMANQNTTIAYVEDCVFFNCSAFAIASVNYAKVYLKGFIDVYNFHSSDILNNIFGIKLPQWMWSQIIQPAAKDHNMIQIGADKREYINFNFGKALGSLYFWDSTTGQYIDSDHGLPSAADHTKPFISIHIPVFGDVNMWGSPVEPGAPNYYDEYDSEGMLRLDFLNNQIKKITRQVPQYWRIW